MNANKQLILIFPEKQRREAAARTVVTNWRLRRRLPRITKLAVKLFPEHFTV